LIHSSAMRYVWHQHHHHLRRCCRRASTAAGQWKRKLIFCWSRNGTKQWIKYNIFQEEVRWREKYTFLRRLRNFYFSSLLHIFFLFLQLLNIAKKNVFTHTQWVFLWPTMNQKLFKYLKIHEKKMQFFQG
jgi:hypothetical protein